MRRRYRERTDTTGEQHRIAIATADHAIEVWAEGVASEAISQGLRAWLAENRRSGFFSNTDGSYVVSFHYAIDAPAFILRYKPKDSPFLAYVILQAYSNQRAGVGRMIEEVREHMAGRGPVELDHWLTVSEQIERYGATMKYREVYTDLSTTGGAPQSKEPKS